MNSPKKVYHLVTRNRMFIGQRLSLGQDTGNTLFRFFFEKKIVNRHGEDFFEILEKSKNGNRIILEEEDSKVAEKYAGITVRAVRETILEMVRLRDFPCRPSRLSSLYAARTLEELYKWKEVFESYNRKALQLVLLSFDGKYFEGDGEKLPKANGESFAAKIRQAEEYWKGNDMCLLPEVLIDGNIVVEEIIEEFELDPGETVIA